MLKKFPAEKIAPVTVSYSEGNQALALLRLAMCCNIVFMDRELVTNNFKHLN
jgi:glucose-6-phosphate dehydrogenase assembly protein OpcA